MIKPLIFGLVLSVSSPALAAEQIVLGSGNIVGASSVFFQGAGDSGTAFEANGARVTGDFGAGNIFDSQLANPEVEVFFGGSYWISGDGVSSSYPTSSPVYITVDLGAVYSLSSFSLFNTTNGNELDRGTGAFQILGSNTLVSDGPNGLTLGGSIEILADGVLQNGQFPNAPEGQLFLSTSNAGVRYIQFTPTSASSPELFAAGAFGLNELKVFGTLGSSAVPEPATWAMFLLGFGAVGYSMRRRKGTTAQVSFA